MADTPGKSASKAHNNESASVNLNLPPDVAQESFDPSDSASTTAATNTTSTRTTPRTPSTPANSASASLPPHPSRFRVPASPRTVAMTNDDSSRAAKVAIPRLKRSLETNDAAAKPGGRHRVTHACEPCRHRKTKCSGERPTCRHCQDFKIECYYADGKRDRVKKYVATPLLLTHCFRPFQTTNSATDNSEVWLRSSPTTKEFCATYRLVSLMPMLT